MKKERNMLAKHRLRFVGSLALVGMMAAPFSPAFAAEAVPPAAPSPSPVELQAQGSWRRYALPVALTATGLSLAGTVGFIVLTRERTDEFNNHRNNKIPCASSFPDRGGPGCAVRYDKMQSAATWAKAGLVLTPLLAATTLVLWLTQPSDQAPVLAATSRPPAPFNLACAPGLGAHASCTLTF